jgi:hypothetical protein
MQPWTWHTDNKRTRKLIESPTQALNLQVERGARAAIAGVPNVSGHRRDLECTSRRLELGRRRRRLPHRRCRRRCLRRRRQRPTDGCACTVGWPEGRLARARQPRHQRWVGLADSQTHTPDQKNPAMDSLHRLPMGTTAPVRLYQTDRCMAKGVAAHRLQPTQQCAAMGGCLELQLRAQQAVYPSENRAATRTQRVNQGFRPRRIR